MSVSTAKINSPASTADREILVTRVFDAPRERVFEAWTDPKHVAQWWGPRGFTTTIHEMDVRPGGVWRLVMRGPDGVDYNNRIVFIEVVKPERLIYKHEPEEGSEPVSFQVTVDFAKAGDKTRLTMQMLFPSAKVREFVIEKYKALDGVNQTLGRLAEHLPQMTADTKDPGAPDLVITRVFDAPRELVFKAWTEHERLKRWWGPKNFTNPVCEVDSRPGGAMRIDMRAPDGRVYPMTGRYEEIVEPERIVFTSGALDAKGHPMFEVLTIVTLLDRGGKTELTLTARVTKQTAAAAPHLAGMEQGWGQSLDRLGTEVEA